MGDGGSRDCPLASACSVQANYINSAYFLTPVSAGNEPVPNSISVNGNVGAIAEAPGGQRLHIRTPAGSKSRLRFVAANALSMYNVSIDGVLMQVRGPFAPSFNFTLRCWSCAVRAWHPRGFTSLRSSTSTALR